jgi:hypothetical protein
VWIATPSLYETFIHNTLPAFTGASERFERFERLGANPIDWTAKRRNLEYRSSEFLGLILYSASLRLAVFLAKEVLGRSSD